MGIRDEDTSSEALLEDVAFHLAAIGADPQASELVAPTEQARDELRARSRARTDASEAEQSASAKFRRSDHDLDEAVRQLELDVYGHVSKNRDAPDYRAIFPRGLTAMIGKRGEEQAREVGTMLGTLAKRLPDINERHADNINGLIDATGTAERGYKDAIAARSRAYADEVVARIDLVTQLRRNEGALRQLYPGNLGRVRSYFRPLRRGGGGGGGGDDGGGGGGEE